MTYYSILAKIGNLALIDKIMKFDLSEYVCDTILDLKSSYLIVLKNMPGILYFKIETTKGVKTHFEVYLRSKGEIRLLGIYPFNKIYPPSSPLKPSLTLVIDNENKNPEN